jgi:hypothetical protein
MPDPLPDGWTLGRVLDHDDGGRAYCEVFDENARVVTEDDMPLVAVCEDGEVQFIDPINGELRAWLFG